MYHICPARCQTQFVRGEDANRRNAASPPRIPRNLPSSLRQPSSAASLAWIRARTLALADRLLDLGGAEHRLSGLVGQRQSAERGFGEQAVDPVGKLLRNLGFGLSARAKTLRFTASATLSRAAVSHTPRPGSFSLRSGTTVPSGPSTKRISSSLGRRGARERTAAERLRPSSSILLSFRRLLPQDLCLLARLMTRRAVTTAHRPRRHASAAASSATSLRRGSSVGLLDPARLDPRIEDHLLDLGPG